jgi:glycosidase
MVRMLMTLAVLWALAPVAAALDTGALGARTLPAIERLEPESWWIGFRHPELQLLVHGDHVAALAPQLDYPGVRLLGTERVDNPNYLFVNLSVDPDTSPGHFAIRFLRAGHEVARREFTLRARAPGSADRRGFAAADAIYLVVPDRFANGNVQNDVVPGYADDQVNRADGFARHGGDIQGIIDHLDYIRDLGFTQLWSTPLLENNQPRFSYHGYAITDHYRIDPRFGSNEDYARLSHEAAARGIGLIMDMVVNHIGGQHWWMRDLPSHDWINDGGRFSPTNHLHISKQDPYAAQVDKDAFVDGWFSPGMPDLNQRNPLLATYLIQNALWWIEYAGLSGIRMDTYPYSDSQFMANWSARVMEEYPHFNIVGEEWNENPAIVSYWQADKVNANGYVSHLPTLMDFPTEEVLAPALRAAETPAGHSGLRQLYEVLSLDFLYPHPSQLVVFADNHDTDRIYTRVDLDFDLFRMAMVYIATVRGTPQLLYGTELLLANDRPGDDGDRRRDFPGGWRDDRVNGFTGAGLGAAQQRAQQFIRTLFQWRRTCAAVRDGRMLHYLPADGVYVYFRVTESERVMVVLNKNAATTQLDLSRFGEVLRPADVGRDIFSGQEVMLDRQLSLAPRSALVLDIR